MATNTITLVGRRTLNDKTTNHYVFTGLNKGAGADVTQN